LNYKNRLSDMNLAGVPQQNWHGRPEMHMWPLPSGRTNATHAQPAEGWEREGSSSPHSQPQAFAALWRAIGAYGHAAHAGQGPIVDFAGRVVSGASSFLSTVSGSPDVNSILSCVS